MLTVAGLAGLLGVSAWATLPLEGTARSAAAALTLGLFGLGSWGVLQIAARTRSFLPAALALLLALLSAEALLRAYQVPPGLIPTPSRVLATLWEARAVLLQDLAVTFLLEALLGFVGGVLLGVLLALWAVRFPFIERGLLPYASIFSCIPIVALAPVLVKAIGLEWTSKAVLVAITVLFPVVVNVVRGLQSAHPLHLELMASYAATPAQVFARVRVPGALPFFFNALKISTTLALISAIVAEFFGTTGQGLGFRIQIEAGRFNFPLVWAAIVLASVVGILFFNLVGFLERRLSGWHVSER
nr:ABC transporter permease subunit [Deinobacterium chartae]